MAAPSGDPVRVEIYGTPYTIKGEGSPDDVRTVARHVDDTMREIASAGGVADSLRVAVLAALTIADDLFRLRREMQELERSISGTAQSCSTLLDQILAEGTGQG